MEASAKIDFSDVQGLVVRGYGKLPAACYLLLRIDERDKARAFLRHLTEQTCFARRSPATSALNLALSHHGLAALGLDPAILAGFSNEFQAGMITAHKRRIFGDEGLNAPEQWDWGGPTTAPVDVLLLCYAVDPETLEERCRQLKADYPRHGVTEIARLETEAMDEFKEHFGFRDSIGQPYFAEFDRHRQGHDGPPGVALGEILLGYPNGYDRYTQRPMVAPDLDRDGLLLDDIEGSARKDLGRNGTYLVFRQLSQDVRTFWQYLKTQAGGETAGDEAVIRLGARMVGRWPSGTALVQAPDADAEMADKDDFAYHREDPDGLKCPLGAHIRRTHPRDSLDPDPGTEKSVAFSNRHRLLRRGRSYGPPFHSPLNPANILSHLDREREPAPRGLHFICLNANIGRQFEFVQHTWANNPTFNGLYRDPDPLIGHRCPYGMTRNHFAVQQEPVRRQFRDLPEFTRVRGGGYFFLPSHRAMRFLFGQ